MSFFVRTLTVLVGYLERARVSSVFGAAETLATFGYKPAQMIARTSDSFPAFTRFREHTFKFISPPDFHFIHRDRRSGCITECTGAERRNPIWSKSSVYCCRISEICFKV